MATETVSDGNYYQKSVDECIKEFNSNLENGLNSSELESRYLKSGYNELPKIKKSIWKVYLAPIFNFLIIILIITGIIVIILGSPENTIITFTVVGANSFTAIVQSYRAQKALESLREISALKATVLRDGQKFGKELPTRELVPGDIILLSQGSKVPADGRIIESMNLTINEAQLTGESEAEDKNNRIIEKDNVPIQDQTNMVWMGTYCNTGRAKVLVTGTGVNTEIGKISSQLNALGSIEEIPLTKRLNRLGYILGCIVIINLIILIVYKFTILDLWGDIFKLNFDNEDFSSALVSSILRAMNIMPINLPLLTTLVLVTGILNMARHGVIIRNLSAVETNGRVSIIASDKTGTITRNEMTVEKFWINNNEYEVSGSGYENNGEILKEGKPINLSDNPTFERFIISSVLNNNANLVYEDVKVKVGDIREKSVRRALGSPTEAALLVLAEKGGYNIQDIKDQFKIMHEYSFSSELKRMTTICNIFEDKYEIYAFSKGAPERILELSSEIEINGKIKAFDSKLKNEISNLISSRANLGFRTLAIAYKKLEEFNTPKRNKVEMGLVFLSFVSIIDPIRIGVKEAVAELKSAGISTVMITGDHPQTAKTIATEIGIYNEGDKVIEGKELKNLSPDEFKKVSVFARILPLEKEEIVKRFQEEDQEGNRHVVAVTGDGINDALALKVASVGIAMGITGVDLAKEVADMTLTDDNFTSIKEGVKIGRGLSAKIRVIIYFFICLNIMEWAIFFGYEFIPTFELFKSEWQHIYIFGVVHSLPALALVIDKPPKNIMEEPPRDEEELLNKNMWIMLLLQAFLMGLGLILAIQFTLGGLIPLNEWNINHKLSYIPKNTSDDELVAMKARTMFITTLYIMETMFLWSFRRPNESIFRSIKDRDIGAIVLIICMITLSLHVLVIIFSFHVNNAINNTLGLNFQLNYMFLSATDWLLCILLALPGIFGIEVYKYYARKRKIFF